MVQSQRSVRTRTVIYRVLLGSRDLGLWQSKDDAKEELDRVDPNAKPYNGPPESFKLLQPDGEYILIPEFLFGFYKTL